MAENMDVAWPQRQDYDDSMEMMREKVRDAVIRRGKLERDRTDSIMRFGGANNYATLYKVDGWMIRCFCQDRERKKSPPIDIEIRYKHISEFCRKHARRATSLVFVEYVPNAIDVDILDRQGAMDVFLRAGSFPFVRMEHVGGLSLGSFISKYYAQRVKMEKLCEAWLHMIQELEQLQMAHGDLDLTNIYVVENNDQVILKLIDYDNVWIPTFAQLPLEQIEIGHEHFQHPAFASKETRAFDQYMDRFAALTMYISLYALMVNPTLYTDPQWGISDLHLLFMKSDYEAEMQSQPSRLSRLASQHIPHLMPLLQELRLCLQELRQPQSLTVLLANRETTRPVASPMQRGAQKSSVSPEEYVYYDWEHVELFEHTKGIPATKAPKDTQDPSMLPEEYVYYDWKHVELFNKVPGAPAPLLTNQSPPAQNMWAPSSHVSQQQQQQTYQAPIPIARQKSQRSSQSVMFWFILVLVLLILVILLGFLFTYVFARAPHTLPFVASHWPENDATQIISVFTLKRL